MAMGDLGAGCYYKTRYNIFKEYVYYLENCMILNKLDEWGRLVNENQE